MNPVFSVGQRDQPRRWRRRAGSRTRPRGPSCASARRSSNTEAPSVSQRGTRWFDSCSVMTCASSCHSVARPVERRRAARARGESSVTTRAEAGAERADHAGQAERAHGEVVVLREHLDQDRPARRDAVALATELGERLARQLHRPAPASARTSSGCSLSDQVVVGDRLELSSVSSIDSEVVGDDVVGIAA